MIKVVYHIADIHIRLFKRHLEYQTVLNELYEGIVEDMKKRGLGRDEVRVAIAGDIVHSKNQMTPELVSFVIKMLNDCTNICKTVIILGNHDFLANNLDRMDALSPLIESLDNKDILFYKDTGCYEDNNIVWCVFSQITGSDRPKIEDSIEKYPDKKHIGLYHDPIVGLKTDVGYEFEDGQEVSIFEGLDWTLCGDIHKREVLKIDKRPVIMVGSLIQQNFGESINKHGFCIIDLENDEYKFQDIENKWGFYSFKIKSIEDIENEKEILI
jgi:DNA repair exonuclease SbcCD nuclease subunit|tara:strand:+ start:2661 stop:3470 length:810 start_codon:yes stop_codon:yes gene_type:complete